MQGSTLTSRLNHSLRPVRIINHPYPIIKRGFARTIRVDHPGRPIQEGDLLPAVGVVVFDLPVWEAVGLHPILVRNLGGL